MERPIERAERLGAFGADNCWVAVLGIRRGLKLRVTGDGRLLDLLIEAWAGEPGNSSDGVAVMELAAGAGWRWRGCRCADAGTEGAGMPGFS